MASELEEDITFQNVKLVMIRPIRRDKPAAEKPSVEEPADSEEAPQVAQTGDFCR